MSDAVVDKKPPKGSRIRANRKGSLPDKHKKPLHCSTKKEDFSNYCHKEKGAVLSFQAKDFLCDKKKEGGRVEGSKTDSFIKTAVMTAQSDRHRVLVCIWGGTGCEA